MTPKKDTNKIWLGAVVMIMNSSGEILLGKRKNAFDAGTYGMPGGHIEVGETIFDAAVRELREEIGVNIQPKALTLLGVHNYLIDDWQRQYITFNFLLKKNFTIRTFEHMKS